MACRFRKGAVMNEPTPTKLKMKIGAHEFEAEGPADVVKEQFESFKALIQALPADVSTIVGPTGPPRFSMDQTTYFDGDVTPSAERMTKDQWKEGLAKMGIGYTEVPRKDVTPDAALNRIMRVENRVVSLTVQVRAIEDAVLLLLFGQKVMRENDSVTGSEIMDGLEISGLKVPRADRVLAKLSDNGDAIAVGLGRAKRYRMTNTGMTKARALAGELIATVA